MASFNVTAVHGEPEKDEYGNLSYWVSLDGVQGNVLVRHKHTTPPLKAGDDAAADPWRYERVEQKESKKGKAYNKLAKTAANFNRGGGGGRSPEEQKAILRQGSQKRAISYVLMLHEVGQLSVPEGGMWSLVQRIADGMCADVDAYVKGGK